VAIVVIQPLIACHNLLVFNVHIGISNIRLGNKTNMVYFCEFRPKK